MTAIGEGLLADIPHDRDQASRGCGLVNIQLFHGWIKSDRGIKLIVGPFRWSIH
jgi:hypothetical protein